MNWVGGWRGRVMKSSDTRKQKEFFEKKRMQSRHNLLAPPPASPRGNGGNMDLLTMFIVNQIALKKEHTGIPKTTHNFSKLKGNHKSIGGESLELPMSPCSPSRLSLAESDPHYSDKPLGLKKRKRSLLDEFKFKTLSPLVETNLSDNSSSACQHRVQGSVGSCSSASPSSSDVFNLQSRPTVHISPLLPIQPHCTKIPQPVGVCEYNPWTVPYQTEACETSFANGVQFGSALNSSESSGPSIHCDENLFKDFEMNDQEEKLHFFGLNGGEDIAGKITTKDILQEDTPHPAIISHEFIKSYNKDRSIDFLSQPMSSCVDCRPCRVHRSVSEHTCESTVTCPQEEGHVTSDNVTNSMPSLRYILDEGKKQHGESYTHVCHSHSCPSGMSAPTRSKSFNKKVMCNNEHSETESKAHGISKTLRRINHKQDCEEDQFVPSCRQTNTQSDKITKKPPRIQDKATQTGCFSSLTSQDASVQCCLLKAATMNIFTEPTPRIHHSRTHKASATRRQTCHSSENNDNQCALSEIHKVEWKKSWTTSEKASTRQGPGNVTGRESLRKSEGKACMKKHPLLHCSNTNAPEVKEQPSKNMVMRRERCEGHEENSVNQNPSLNSSCTGEHNIAFAAETGGDRVSEQNENLKEIADILLMLKQKNKHL